LKVWFSIAVEALESEETFFRPAGGKMEIPIVPGVKLEIPKSAGQ